MPRFVKKRSIMNESKSIQDGLIAMLGTCHNIKSKLQDLLLNVEWIEEKLIQKVNQKEHYFSGLEKSPNLSIS